MRRKLLALVIVVLGLCAGILAPAAYPPFYASQAIVNVDAGGEWDPPSLAIMLTSDRVLVEAAHRLGSHKTASDLRGNLQVTYASLVFTLTAKGRDPRQAKAVASAVTASFSDFLPRDDHVLKRGLPTRKPVTVTVLRSAGPGTAERPLGITAETGGLGLLAGVLLAFLVAQPSRREVRRGYRAAFRLIFGRGRIATNVLELIDGTAAEDERKVQRHAGRDKRLTAWHLGRTGRSRELAGQVERAS
jgi:capsular polysaccharide biosynthesis protein